MLWTSLYIIIVYSLCLHIADQSGMPRRRRDEPYVRLNEATSLVVQTLTLS